MNAREAARCPAARNWPLFEVSSFVVCCCSLVFFPSTIFLVSFAPLRIDRPIVELRSFPLLLQSRKAAGSARHP